MGNTSKTPKTKAAPKKAKAPKTKAKSFVERVLAKAKTDNPGNLELFRERVVRYADREAQKVEDKLIDALAKAEDASGRVYETVLDVELTSITTISHINDYVPHFVSNIEDAMNSAKAENKAIEKLMVRRGFYLEVADLMSK